MKLYTVLRRYEGDRDYFHVSEEGHDNQYFTDRNKALALIPANPKETKAEYVIVEVEANIV